ncbi:leucine-rich repeat protein [uncultured Pseudoflavonifractor sp.]|uniref:leucine-rich repeat protein n=1 Tax=uncultured Pseudoflavonifractor sp. TaxID=1221379 RepID=UPI0025D540BC|nr:leucine-rich repeat protein [uncultured Pseudoflavonifractor sp.]
MKKRALSLLLALCLCLSLMPAASASVVESTVQVGPYTFEIWFDGTATLTRYDESLADSTYADIPASVTDENGQEYPVTVIGEKAFEETNITGVTVPDSVISIGRLAFAYCNSLSDVKLSESLIYINELAFASCDALKEITIPASVEEMDNPFRWSNALDTVYMEGMVAPEYYFNPYAAYREGNGEVVFVIPKGATGYEDWSSRNFVHSVIYEGESVPGYGISLSPSTVDFGTTLTGNDYQPEPRVVTVTNSGDRSLVLKLPDDRPDWIFHWESDYSWLGSSVRTLEAGESCTFTVEPRPGRDYGTHSETVTVTTQEGASADLHLSYTVQTPNFRVTVSTEAIDFGAVEVGYAQPAPRSISFTNEDDYKISLNGTSELRVEWSKSGFVYSHGHMSARIAPHETVTYTVQPQTGLKPGIYIQHVRGNFTSSHIGGDTFQSFDIPVTFIVAAEGDLPSSWAAGQLSQAAVAGIVPDSFESRYTQAATRAEFCALAVRLYEKATGETITQRATFSDTTDFNVQKMAGLGVVNGVGGGKFDPGGTLTREQAATILARLAEAMGHPLPQAAPAFSDSAAIASWAAAGVGQVQAAGIMEGNGSAFTPQGAYTREQCILTVLRLYQLTQS